MPEFERIGVERKWEGKVISVGIERFRGAIRAGLDTVEVRCYEAHSLQLAGQGAQAILTCTLSSDDEHSIDIWPCSPVYLTALSRRLASAC